MSKLCPLHELQHNGEDTRAADLPRNTEIEDAVIGHRVRRHHKATAHAGSVHHGHHQGVQIHRLVVEFQPRQRRFEVQKDGLNGGHEVADESAHVLHLGGYKPYHGVESDTNAIAEVAAFGEVTTHNATHIDGAATIGC